MSGQSGAPHMLSPVLSPALSPLLSGGYERNRIEWKESVHCTSPGVSVWCRCMHRDLLASHTEPYRHGVHILYNLASRRVVILSGHSALVLATVVLTVCSWMQLFAQCTTADDTSMPSCLDKASLLLVFCLIPFARPLTLSTADCALQDCALLGHFAWPHKLKVILMCHTAPGGQEMQRF